MCLAVVVLLSGCAHYSERFTYRNPDTGSTNHVVHVSHTTFLMFGKAAELSTETQTMEFIRTVNAKDIESSPDAESVKAVTEGLVEGAAKAFGKP